MSLFPSTEEDFGLLAFDSSEQDNLFLSFNDDGSVDDNMELEEQNFFHDILEDAASDLVDEEPRHDEQQAPVVALDVSMEPDPLSKNNVQVVRSISLLPKHLTGYATDYILALTSATRTRTRTKTKTKTTTQKKQQSGPLSAAAKTPVSFSDGPTKTPAYFVSSSASSGSGSVGETTSQMMKVLPHQEQQWMDRYQDLASYFSREGHSNVPYTYKADPGLVLWVKRQRHQCKRKNEGRHSNLTQDRVQLLNMVNFNWDSRGNSWTKNYQRLQEFHKLHGHPHVPAEYDSSLANWIKRQKTQYRLFYKEKKTSSMTKDKVSKLSNLDFYYNHDEKDDQKHDQHTHKQQRQQQQQQQHNHPATTTTTSSNFTILVGGY